jgi:high-affinity iron transporter
MFAGALAAAAAAWGELFNAAPYVAVAMLTWHSVWMTRHGRNWASRSVMSVGPSMPEHDRFMHWLS